MIASVIIILLIAIIALKLLKFDHHARTIKIIFFTLIILLLYFSIMSVLNSGNADLGSPRGITKTISFYFGWLGQTVWNLWDIGADTVKTVGNAIKVNSTEQNQKR
ncbi:MAG: hypothetical protein WC494_00765 [Candidatus Pacearchaeota archaeon]